MNIQSFEGDAAHWPEFKATIEALAIVQGCDGPILAPPDPSASETKQAKYQQANMQLYARLILHTKGLARRIVEGSDRSGHDAWVALIAMYEASSTSRKQMLYKELITADLQDDQDPDILFRRLEHLQTQLNTLAAPIPDELLAVIALQGLPPGYSVLTTILNAQPDLTYNSLKSQASAHYSSYLQPSTNSLGPTASSYHATTVSPQPHRSRCRTCGGHDHHTSQCRRAMPASASAARGRRSHMSPAESRADFRAKTRATTRCFKCQGLGHWADECSTPNQYSSRNQTPQHQTALAFTESDPESTPIL